MKNSLGDLNDHLFATLEALRDKDNPMDLDRAKAVCEVGQTIINAGKLEVEHIKATGRGSAKLLEEKPALPPPSPALLKLAASQDNGA